MVSDTIGPTNIRWNKIEMTLIPYYEVNFKSNSTYKILHLQKKINFQIPLM